jgi:cysteine desulfurase
MPDSYFDHNATTPLHPEVAAVMAEYLGAAGIRGVGLGNPSSIHSAGREARRLVEDAREALARLLAVATTEIIFTGGGTEADNLAILGAAASGKLPGRHFVTSSFEHPAVLEAFRKLEALGHEVTWVEPDGNGIVSAEAVENALRPDTGLVSVMAANNEVGTVQPVGAIGRMLRARGTPFHCDGVQALGKLDATHPRKWQADFLAVSAHKINGPKGVGALYVRKGAPMQGLALGGPQERGFRGGTENVLGIIGFGKAAEVALRDGPGERIRLARLRDGLEGALRNRLPDLVVNGAEAERLPNTLNVTLPGCSSDMLVMGLDMRGVAVSAGSACASGSVKYSHVLLAMGKGKDAASSSIRFSLGLGNGEEDIAPLAEKVAEVAASVRGL